MDHIKPLMTEANSIYTNEDPYVWVKNAAVVALIESDFAI